VGEVTMLQTLSDISASIAANEKAEHDRLYEVLVDDTHAVMTEKAYAALPGYHCSIPTGFWPGKRWALKISDKILMGEYAESEKGEGWAKTIWREVLFV